MKFYKNMGEMSTEQKPISLPSSQEENAFIQKAIEMYHQSQEQK